MRGLSILAALVWLLPVAAHAHHHDWGNNNPAPAPIVNPKPVPNGPDDRQAIPVCVDKQGDRIADPNNDQVLQWKKTEPNQYQDRGYIRGTLVGVYDATKGHLHLDVFLGNDGTGQHGSDTDIEVIYNQDFGAVDQSQLKIGADVIACGDFIQSTKQSGPYPPSPLGAILHWVHKAMNDRHANGFLIIDGRPYGQMDAPPRPGHNDGNGN
jgi:hypothetical protein